MTHKLLAFSLALVFLFGCSRHDSAKQTIDVIGGTRVLHEACEALIQSNDLAPTEDYFVDASDIPPDNALAKLNPQFVTQENVGDRYFYNIQVSGGFRHAGYLVAVETNTPVSVLPLPTSWKKTHIGENVFWYSE